MTSSSPVSAEHLAGLIRAAAAEAAKSVASQFIPAVARSQPAGFIGNPDTYEFIGNPDTPMHHDSSNAATTKAKPVADTKGTAFPPGVESLEQWGETVVRYGRRMVGKTYQELLGEEFAWYRKYVLDQKDAGPGLADFQAFLIRAGANTMKGTVTSEPIPGTSVPRLRRPSVKNQAKENGKAASSNS
jgi:hypothetical protein